MKRASLFSFIALGLSLSSAAASADPVGAVTAPADDVAANVESAPESAPRSWLYLDDPTLAAPLRAIAFSRVTYTGAGASPTRPFGADLAHPGGVVEAGGEVGLLPWLSLAASGYSASAAPTDNGSFGAFAGIRISPLSPAGSTHLVLSGGVLRELAGGTGAWARASIAQDIGRARIGGTVHAEHVFQSGRDDLDVMVMAGASYGVAGPLRLGVEYVAQDIEESAGAEAEAGIRHFVGPTAGVELLQKRLTINGGPAAGLSAGSPHVLARLGVAYAF